METETYQFWEMVLNAPATLAIAGGLAGSFITLVVTILTFRHTTKAKKLEWERSESRRKEERHFELKIKAYDQLSLCVKDYIGGPIDIMHEHLLVALKYTTLYGSDKVREAAHKLFDFMMLSEQEENQQALFSKAKELSYTLRTYMREDLEIHLKHIKE